MMSRHARHNRNLKIDVVMKSEGKDIHHLTSIVMSEMSKITLRRKAPIGFIVSAVEKLIAKGSNLLNND